MSKFLLILIIFFGTAWQAGAQSTDFKPNNRARSDSLSQERNVKFSGMGGPGYTPELKLILGGSLVTTYSINASDTSLQRSTNILNLAVGIKGAVIFNDKGKLFFRDDRFRLGYNVWFKYMPDNYFGVGYDQGLITPLGENTTAYQRNWFQLTPEFLFNVVRDLYAGILVDINQTLCSEVNPLMQQDPSFIRFGPDNLNVGIGVTAQYDSRDNVANAYEGFYTRISATDYTTLLGSENSYQAIEFDYRQFQRLGRPRHVLAWNLKSRIGIGNVPYPELSMVGSPYDLRGYLWGRFRDRTMILGILEYRHMFNPLNPERQKNFWSRHGLVIWTGAGFIGDGVNDWMIPEVIPNAGLGYRFELLPRMNVRFDVGFGLDGSTGFYLEMTEAF